MLFDKCKYFGSIIKKRRFCIMCIFVSILLLIDYDIFLKKPIPPCNTQYAFSMEVDIKDIILHKERSMPIQAIEWNITTVPRRMTETASMQNCSYTSYLREDREASQQCINREFQNPDIIIKIQDSQIAIIEGKSIKPLKRGTTTAEVIIQAKNAGWLCLPASVTKTIHLTIL